MKKFDSALFQNNGTFVIWLGTELVTFTINHGTCNETELLSFKFELELSTPLIPTFQSWWGRWRRNLGPCAWVVDVMVSHPAPVLLASSPHPVQPNTFLQHPFLQALPVATSLASLATPLVNLAVVRSGASVIDSTCKLWSKIIRRPQATKY